MNTARLLGYFLVLAPPAMLAWSVPAGHEWWTFLAFVAASPLTRALFGVHSPRESHVSEGMARVLYWMPATYAAALFVALWRVAGALPAALESGTWSTVGAGLSLWTVMVFGLFPSHEMLHRRDRGWIRLGSLVAGACGYPLWGAEHATHHLRAGSASSAEWARADESVWNFIGRRLPVVGRTAWHSELSLLRVGHWPGLTTPLTLGTAALIATAIGFAWQAGFAGATLFVICALSVAISAQIMTYVQHWGLGDDSVPDAARKELAWEDDCLMQAWLTLNNSFHLAHHRTPHAPYFFVGPSTDSPRQPGCYVAMLGICVFPALWKRLMVPVLESYKRDEKYVCAPGRRAICITPSRLIAVMSDGDQRVDQAKGF